LPPAIIPGQPGYVSDTPTLYPDGDGGVGAIGPKT
jgi:hypothetical protein